MEFRSRVNSTSDRSSSIDFCFHSRNSANSSVFGHSNSRVFFNSRAFNMRERRGYTIHTFLNRTTRVMFRVFSNILLTSYSRHSMFSSPSININRISSITGTSSITIYNSLYSISSRRPLILSLNIQSISQRRQSRLSPTRSTINRNMLIHTPTHIVLSSNISPVPYLRNIINIQVFKRLSRQNKIRNIISSFIIHTRIYRFSFQIGLFF